LSAGFVDDLAQRKGELLQVWKEAFVFLDGKRSEKPVFKRMLRSDEYRHE
jgi:hypothetical protein